MPELPEVETIVRKLRPVVVDHEIVAAQVLWGGVVDRPDVTDFLREIVGAHFTDIDRRGKYLLFRLDSGAALLVHLRMSGKFSIRSPAEGPGDHRHARVQMKLDDGTWLVYIDQRKFGRFYLVDDPEHVVEDLGPEPLGPDFTIDELRDRLSGRRGEIKRLLLNQSFLAGLGNIYANEVLWLARIHPERIAGTLNDREIERLHDAIVTVLEQGIRHGGTSLDDRQYVYPDGRLGGHQNHLQVYDRAGDACPRCGYIVERFVQGQRSSYFCPHCQMESQNNPK